MRHVSHSNASHIWASCHTSACRTRLIVTHVGLISYIRICYAFEFSGSCPTFECGTRLVVTHVGLVSHIWMLQLMLHFWIFQLMSHIWMWNVPHCHTCRSHIIHQNPEWGTCLTVTHLGLISYIWFHATHVDRVPHLNASPHATHLKSSAHVLYSKYGSCLIVIHISLILHI